MTYSAVAAVMGAILLVISPSRARAEPRFAPETFQLSTAEPKRCTPAQLEATATQLEQLRLARHPGDADLTGVVACTTGVTYVDVGGVKVPERSQTISLQLDGRYGARFEQVASGTRLSLDRPRALSFLAEHASGCSITAPSAESFRLMVVSEALGAPLLQFSYPTPFVLRGLKAGQAFSVSFGSTKLDGCGANGELMLEAPASAGGAASRLPEAHSPPAPTSPPPKRWWTTLIALAAVCGLGVWWFFQRRKAAALPIKEKLGVFISYRRDDSGGYAGRLFDDLAQNFDKKGLFIDESSIALGTDFAPVIERAIAKTDVMLVLMGKQWLPQLNARLGTTDFVRLEVELGLAKRAYLVVPVLVGGGALAPATELPDSLKSLVGRQAFELRPARWDDDVAELIQRLRGAVPNVTSLPSDG